MAVSFPMKYVHCIPDWSYGNCVVDALGQEAAQAANQQMRALLGPVGILWDIENCPVPLEVRPEDVAGNIRMAMQVHPVIKGVVTMFSAYGDFSIFPRMLREGCQKTGVNLIDVPHGKKDAADKAILVDMFLFALDNHPPCTIFLISGDVDFASALHKLGQRGYTVVLAIPAGVRVSSALCNAGRFVWDWPSLARGEGLIAVKSFLFPSPELPGYLVGGFSSDNSNFQNDEETIVYRGIHQNEYNIENNSNQMYCLNSNQMSMDLMKTSVVSEEYETDSATKISSNARGMQAPSSQISTSVANAQDSYLLRSSSLMQKNREASFMYGPSKPVQTSSLADCGQPRAVSSETSAGQTSATWVQPGDIHGLKRQLVNLVNVYGGSLPLVRVPSEYHKAFGRPLYLAEYGSCKLVNLVKKMHDVLIIEGKGHKKFLCLKQLPNELQEGKMNTNFPAKGSTEMIQREELIRNSAKGKGIQEYRNADDCNELQEYRNPDECSEPYDIEAYSTGSEDERGSLQDEDGIGDTILDADMDSEEYATKSNLEVFKYELQELLVSHACKILLTSFLTLYQQRYAKDLNFTGYGVQELEPLIEKVRDVAIIKEEQGTRRKFIVANCSSDIHKK